MFLTKSMELPTPATALPGRDQSVPVIAPHFVNGRLLTAEPAAGHEMVVFGLGCFWGAERLFWKQPGVHVTAVGYAGGITRNPSYEEVCSGRTGHTEVVRVVYDPAQVSFGQLLKLFWESHDPTQGMRQGNDRGTQYRSAIYTTSETQLEQAQQSLAEFQQALAAAGHGTVTTEVGALDRFYFAEDYHQQYLAKNPGGYCGIAGLGVCYAGSESAEGEKKASI